MLNLIPMYAVPARTHGGKQKVKQETEKAVVSRGPNPERKGAGFQAISKPAIT
jgi:hypothetical protein